MKYGKHDYYVYFRPDISVNYDLPEHVIREIMEQKKIWYSAGRYHTETLWGMVKENYTSMRFPSISSCIQEKKVQQQNYDYFIHTMAVMVEKYAPQVLD